MPTLYVIGTADPLVPLRGGEVRSPWGTASSAGRRSPRRWSGGRASSGAPDPVEVADADGVREEVYPGPVAFRAVTVEGLGHHWPGGKGQLNHRVAGPPRADLDATAFIWEFVPGFHL